MNPHKNILLLFPFFLLLTFIPNGYGQNHSLTDFRLPESLGRQWETMHESKKDCLIKFNDDKLGMFIHWGLYSLISGEWKGKKVQGLGEWAMYSECIPRDDYAELAKQFNPTKFDPVEWVRLAKNAGMKYIVITAKHHDGFALFSSDHSEFDISDMTPCKIEPLDMLYKECQKQGIGLGFYYSHVIDWYDGWSGEGGWPNNEPELRRKKSNPMNTWSPSGNSREFYFKNKAYPQVQELLDRFPRLYSLWFDYWYEGKYINPPESYMFYKMVYDTQPHCLVNSRVGHGLGDYIVAGDNQILEKGQTKKWETPGTLNNTWGYSKHDNDWKSEKELIYWLVNIISRGGNYLLNIGPKPDGSIPEGTIKGFAAIGRWMNINSEAAYGTSSWEIIHEGETELSINGTVEREKKGFSTVLSDKEYWFTTKGNTIFAIALEWPADRKIHIHSITDGRVKKLQRVSLLGYGELSGWKMNENGLSLTLPNAELNTVGYVVKIETN